MLQLVTTNVTGAVRHDRMGGRDYLVAPMVMITEGVHNGSNGPLYYPADELAKTPVIWNHKPIVVYHPTENGEGVSACSPEVLTSRGVGLIMNTKFRKGNKKNPISALAAEAWLETDRVTAVDIRILEALESEEMMELSTGLFTDDEETPGEFNGKAYDAVARNYRPDHLALLPDMKGACSIADGAGFLRINNEQAKRQNFLAQLRGTVREMVANEKSFDQIREDLYQLVKNKFGKKDQYDMWVMDVYRSFFVYNNGGKLFKLGYVTSDVKTLLADEVPQEVVRFSGYKTIEGEVVTNDQDQDQKPNQEISQMGKKEVVDNLISNTATSGWLEADRAFLMGLEEPKLVKFTENMNAAIKAAKPPEPVIQPVVIPQVPAAPVANAAPAAPKMMTEEEYIMNAPPTIREALVESINTSRAEKGRLIGEIKANAANTFSDDQLLVKSIPDLKAIAALAKPVKNHSPINPPSYFGNGGAPILNSGAGEEEPYILPVANWGDEAKAG